MILPLSFLIIILLVFGTMVFAGFSAAPWVPSFKKDLILAISAAGIKPGETVYDDARAPKDNTAVAKTRPGSRSAIESGEANKITKSKK